MRTFSFQFFQTVKAGSKSRAVLAAAGLIHSLAADSQAQNPAPAGPAPQQTHSSQIQGQAGQPPLEAAAWLQTASTHFENQYTKTVLDPYNARLDLARKSYLEKLESAVSKASSAGADQEAADLREERERFFNARRMAPPGPAPCKSAEEIRAAFRTELAGMEKERAAASKSCHAQFDAALAQAQASLLQRGMSAEATQVGLKRAEITRDWLAPATVHEGAKDQAGLETAPTTNREAVETGVRWLLGMKGQISYLNGSRQVEVTGIKDWPVARVDVASLSISRPLNNPVPAERDFLHLAPLRGARELSISGFPVGDDAFAFLDDWKDVVRFSLSGANISDALGKRLSRFKTLLHLSLSSCPQITSEVLNPILGSAEDLLTLQLDSTDLGDSCTELIAGFPNLTTLSLRETRLTNAGLKNIARIRSLRSLNILNTHVTPEGLDCLAGLKLRSLSYLSTDMPDFEAAAATLARFQPHLETLIIGGSELRPEHVAALKPFRRLTRLDLLANSPQPGSMEAVAQLPAVENIRIISAAFSDPHLVALTHCYQIKSLDLTSTSITEKGISKLRSLKELRILRTSAKITDTAAQRLKNAVPGLKLYK